jgi:hypothetical protein
MRKPRRRSKDVCRIQSRHWPRSRHRSMSCRSSISTVAPEVSQLRSHGCIVARTLVIEEEILDSGAILITLIANVVVKPCLSLQKCRLCVGWIVSCNWESQARRWIFDSHHRCCFAVLRASVTSVEEPIVTLHVSCGRTSHRTGARR